jgi:hypothetical protein
MEGRALFLELILENAGWHEAKGVNARAVPGHAGRSQPGMVGSGPVKTTETRFRNERQSPKTGYAGSREFSPPAFSQRLRTHPGIRHSRFFRFPRQLTLL